MELHFLIIFAFAYLYIYLAHHQTIDRYPYMRMAANVGVSK